MLTTGCWRSGERVCTAEEENLSSERDSGRVGEYGWLCRCHVSSEGGRGLMGVFHTVMSDTTERRTHRRARRSLVLLVWSR